MKNLMKNQLLEPIHDELFNHMGTDLQFGYVMLAIGLTFLISWYGYNKLKQEREERLASTEVINIQEI